MNLLGRNRWSTPRLLFHLLPLHPNHHQSARPVLFHTTTTTSTTTPSIIIRRMMNNLLVVPGDSDDGEDPEIPPVDVVVPDTCSSKMIQDEDDKFQFQDDDDDEEEEEPMEVPKYDENAKAIDVFDNIYFYRKDFLRKYFSLERQEVLGDMTVKQVYIKFCMNAKDGTYGGKLSLASALGIRRDPLFEYYEDVPTITIEEALHTMMNCSNIKEEDIQVVNQVLSQIFPSRKY